jgi:hypothetical protein
MHFLDDVPMATLVFIVGSILIVIGYIDNTVSFDEAFKSLLFLGGGSGALGYVRNQAGKGIHK